MGKQRKKQSKHGTGAHAVVKEGEIAMKIFKNFKTKRALIEENARLKAMLQILQKPQQVHTVERNVQKVQSSFVVSYKNRDIPEEIIKTEIASNMIEYLKPFIEYDFFDDERGGKIYKGSLYIANRK